MRRSLATLSLIAALTVPGVVAAHEGHAHKVKGTVTAVNLETKQIEILGTDNHTVKCAVTEHTKFLRGQAMASLADVKVGSRVVVKLGEEGESPVATEILLSESPTAVPAPEKSSQPEHQHRH